MYVALKYLTQMQSIYTKVKFEKVEARFALGDSNQFKLAAHIKN